MRSLSGQQTRQYIDTKQLYETLQSAQSEYDHRFRGSMTWKHISERDYLYRKRHGDWESLGPRSADTERIFVQFHNGRAEAKERIETLKAQLERMAPINRAMGLGRMPSISARILRRLDRAGIIEHAIRVVGTHAMFAYEGLAAIQFDSDHVSTFDIDLLYNARASLKMVGPELAQTGLLGQLKKVDRSFSVPRGGFRAANDEGFLVDLIAPQPKLAASPAARRRIGADVKDQEAAEIEGLAWLQNSPTLSEIVIDEKGLPVRMLVPDPRAFAVHKAWLSLRANRDAGKRRRDLAQARAVANMVRTHLRDMPFDDDALQAFPVGLRARALDMIEGGVRPISSSEDW